ncbi:MAG TPA: FAD-dependent oxidoreductase [Xanthobacteraceae bacterium]|jgi:monoamine oxidase|nr:FAD-dependent oxidoreductase [Xanthobacteraceae bacterium]
MHEIDVVVIGAGAAGVAAARRLAAVQIPALVLEARTRVGGRAWTMREPSGLALDLGCGWLHSADENEWAALAPTLGLTVDRTPPPWGGRRRTIGFPSADQEEFRAESERFFARIDAAAEDPLDRPASDFLEPGSRWNPLLNAVGNYISGGELACVSSRDLALYHESGVNWRVTEGYGALVGAYAAPLDIRLDCPVTVIDHSGPRLRVATPRGDISARAAIVALPASLLASGAVRFAPALPDKRAAADALPLGLADKLFLRVDAPETLPIESRLFGALDQSSTGSYHLRPFGRPVVECYFAGRLAWELEREGERAFAQVAADQLADHLGGDIRKRLHPIATTAWGRDPHALGSYSYARPGQTDARRVLAAPVDDRLFFAGEACSTYDYSTAHGAYRTGVAAANSVAKLLKK